MSALTGLETVAIQILLDRALSSAIKDINGKTTIESFIKLFERVSGLRTNHCAICADHTLEFDGLDGAGKPFHIKSDPVAADRDWVKLTKELALKARPKRMAKPSEASRRLSEFKKRIEGKTDELLAKLDGAEKQVDPAFDRANQVLDDHAAEIDAMESELRQLSNLPLDK